MRELNTGDLSTEELSTREFCVGPLIYDGDHGYPLVY